MNAGARQRGFVVEIACLLAFAALIETSWLGLVDPHPVRRALAAVALSGGMALALTVSGRIRRPALRRIAAALTVIAGFAGLFGSAGVPAGELVPGNWSEIVDGLSSGLRGATSVTLPYAGPGEWVRISILLVPALLIGLATAIAFWPRSSATSRRRHVALVVLVAAYAIGAAWYTPSGQLLRGAVLTVLICSWLWLPGLGRGPLAIGFACAIVAALVALPVAAAADRSAPLLDYRSWSPLGGDNAVHFRWTHTYGPLNWQQRGTEMLRVRSPQPLYWKAEVLDVFNGTAWSRSSRTVLNAVESSPTNERAAGIPRQALLAHPDWVQKVEITVGKLRSRRLIGSGVVTDVQGVRTQRPGADGTTLTRGDPLREGDSYSFDTYTPSPTTIQLDGAGTNYPAGIDRFTRMQIPFAGTPPPIPGTPPRDTLTQVTVPPGAGSADLALERRILTGSRYSGMLRLSRRVTAGQKSQYDKVVAIKQYLRESFRYDQQVPEHDFPLPAFIAADKAGYCQQFSGAMALMLRMVGVPARVASGFSTGEINGSNNSFIVRDLDAHSWVEAYFPRIGWITFDPTPPVAPAVQPNSGDGTGAEFIGVGDQRRSGAQDRALRRKQRIGGSGANERARARSGGSDSASGGLPWPALLIPVAVGGLAWERRRRRLVGDDPLPQLAELARVDARLGSIGSPNPTLLEVEGRLGRVAGPKAARYAAALREHRFGAKPRQRPGPSERRALRRALVRRGGPISRWGAWRLLPPGGPPRR